MEARTLDAHTALARLQDGNRRFVNGTPESSAVMSAARRAELIEGQAPFAVILGCSDSRVPVELIFDQGLGDLFVIRVAGNVVASSQVGSVEFAAEAFGTRLVVVMGHTRCGAIRATLDELQRPSASQSPGLRSIVDRVRPAVANLLDGDDGADPEALRCKAGRANVRISVDHLRHGSEVLEHLIEHEGLMVVGAEYSLETGEVDFFDLPDAVTPLKRQRIPSRS